MEKEEWNSQVNHPMQSREWGEFRAKRQPVSRVAGMLVIWTKIKFTPWYFGYIPMGKIPSREEIKLLKDEAIKNKAIGIRMEPNAGVEERPRFAKGFVGGRPLFKPKTFIWDLEKSEEELLKNMHPKGRYNIKVAQKHGVRVRIGARKEDFEKYLDLMFSGTTKRQKIYSHSRDYHRLLWDSLKDSLAFLFVAEYQNEVLAASMVFKFKDGIYYAYGASALEHKEVMAQTLLLWEVARWGKIQGCKFFDLWGAEEKKGFSRFKEQFGAESVETAGTFDLPVNFWLYKLFRLAEEVRWKILRIIK